MHATAARGARWTDDDKQQVAELLRQGASAIAIAGHFPATTRNSIIGLVHRSKTLLAVGFASAPKKPPKVIMHKPLIKPPCYVVAKPKDEPKRKPKPVVLPEMVAPCHIPMLAIGFCQCRFPLWEGDGGPDWLMCGAATKFERSYCAGHAVRVFQPPRWRDG